MILDEPISTKFHIESGIFEENDFAYYERITKVQTIGSKKEIKSWYTFRDLDYISSIDKGVLESACYTYCMMFLCKLISELKNHASKSLISIIFLIF